MDQPTSLLKPSLERVALWTFSMAWFVGLLGFVWTRWQNLGFATFDLAFYLQSLWGFCHGHWNVTLLDVPMLGNHGDWIVMLLTPIYALAPHAMIPVIAQVLLLALMAPLGMRIAEGLGFAARDAALLGLALLLTPATAFVATHEFHPEALTSLFLLCLYSGEQRRSKVVFWLSLAGVLACKENMALLLPFWFGVQGWRRWRGGENGRQLMVWYGPSLVLGVGYFFLYQAVLQPKWNPGLVDYWNLYSHLGASPREALANLFTHPLEWIGRAWRGTFPEPMSPVRRLTLAWGLLLPMLLLPFLRPGWLIVATPLLAQHLLSWRTSEWMISNHYPAPLIPIFWLAAVEGLTWLRGKLSDGGRPSRPASLVQWTPWAILATCIALTFVIGLPTRTMTDALVVPDGMGRLSAGDRLAFVHQQIQPADSVFAPLPYQSHLANRRELYSTHLLLKGLNTLSNTRWQPPAQTDVVLMDFADLATFNTPSGYYHPRLFGKGGASVPSSDELFAGWMGRYRWERYQVNEVAVWRRLKAGDQEVTTRQGESIAPLGSMGRWTLVRTTMPKWITPRAPSTATLQWSLGVHDSSAIPWVDLVLVPVIPIPGNPQYKITKGWSLPAAPTDHSLLEQWHLQAPRNIPAWKFNAFLHVYDRRVCEFPNLAQDPKWVKSQGGSTETFLVPLGEMELRPE